MRVFRHVQLRSTINKSLQEEPRKLTVGVKENCDLLAQFSGRGLPVDIRFAWSHKLGARVILEP